LVVNVTCVVPDVATCAGGVPTSLAVVPPLVSLVNAQVPSLPSPPVVLLADADADADGDVDELKERAAKAGEYLALAQRTQADFENYRKRAARETAAATQRGAMKLAKELLPAVDNLERALAHAPEAGREEEDAFVAGVKAVHADLIAALQRAGIEGYSPEGERFDPTLHEAVAQQPFEGFSPGTVVEVFQRGYRIGESVLRPARVVVAG
jgi:molecular chaperone GrpE